VLFLAFTLRASSNVRGDEMNLMIAPTIITESNSLVEALKSKVEELIENAIHKLTMAILNCPSKANERFICPLSRFILYASLSPSGRFDDPKGINATLTELKWPLRASTFWEIVLQSQDNIHDGNTEL
jgi:hypothetical protein